VLDVGKYDIQLTTEQYIPHKFCYSALMLYCCKTNE